MPADNLIDGRAIAQKVHADTESRVAALKSAGVEPELRFVRVGGDPASQVYVGMKERTAARLGIRSETTVLPEDTPEADLLINQASIDEYLERLHRLQRGLVRACRRAEASFVTVQAEAGLGQACRDDLCAAGMLRVA